MSVVVSATVVLLVHPLRLDATQSSRVLSVHNYSPCCGSCLDDRSAYLLRVSSFDQEHLPHTSTLLQAHWPRYRVGLWGVVTSYRTITGGLAIPIIVASAARMPELPDPPSGGITWLAKARRGATGAHGQPVGQRRRYNQPNCEILVVRLSGRTRHAPTLVGGSRKAEFWGPESRAERA
jgi:hypothetical protein